MSVFDYLRLPRVTATELDSGEYRVIVEVAGIAPLRGLTGEELLAGIESLDPPTIVASTANEAKALAVRATAAAIDATSPISFPLYVATAYAVGYAVAGALVDLGVDA